MTKIINLKEDIDTMEEVPLPGMGGISVSVWPVRGILTWTDIEKPGSVVSCPGCCLGVVGLDVIGLAPCIEVCVLLRLDHGGGWVWLVGSLLPCFDGVTLSHSAIVVHWFTFTDRFTCQSASAGVLCDHLNYWLCHCSALN